MHNPVVRIVKPQGRNLRKHRYSRQGFVYLVTTCCSDRANLFRDNELGDIVVNEIFSSDESGRSDTYAYVVMPDHVHWLFQLGSADSLSAVVRKFKGRSSYRINEMRNGRGIVWQPGYHDRVLRNDESIESVGNYVIANPVRAGLVARVEEYSLSGLMGKRMSGGGDRG